MPVDLSDIRGAVRGVTKQFDRAYWLQCAHAGRFTDEFSFKMQSLARRQAQG